MDSWLEKTLLPMQAAFSLQITPKNCLSANTRSILLLFHITSAVYSMTLESLASVAIPKTSHLPPILLLQIKTPNSCTDLTDRRKIQVDTTITELCLGPTTNSLAVLLRLPPPPPPQPPLQLPLPTRHRPKKPAHGHSSPSPGL